MTFKKIAVVWMFIVWVFFFLCRKSTAEDGESYVRDACSGTRYNDICVHSLASYSDVAKRDPRLWARAGVSVTIGNAKQVAERSRKLKNRGAARQGRNRSALLDCIELFEDALDNLHRSLGVLRELSGQDFQLQMEDARTWVSAALTDEDTCIDGFSDGKQFKFLQNQVLNATYLTSNALALINKLGTTGLGPSNS